MPCPNGHDILPGDEFCGTCGQPALATPEQTPPVDGTCPNGHVNSPGQRFCGTCGAAISALAPDSGQPATDEISQGTEPKGRSTRLVWVGVAIVAVLITGIVILTKHSASDSSSDDASLKAETTTTLISDLCAEELSLWLPYVTGGVGSITDAFAEFGRMAPEAGIILRAETLYQRNLYAVGRDDASTKAYALINKECITLGTRYEAGHLPPA